MSTGFSATNTRVAGDTLNIAAPAAIAPSLPRSASAVSESSIPPGCGFPSPNSKLSPCPPTPALLPETPRASFWGVPCSCAATSPASTWPPLRSGKTHAESDHCDKTVRPSPDARQPLVFFLSLNCECDFSCTQRRKSHGWVVDAPGLPLTSDRQQRSQRTQCPPWQQCHRHPRLPTGIPLLRYGVRQQAGRTDAPWPGLPLPGLLWRDFLHSQQQYLQRAIVLPGRQREARSRKQLRVCGGTWHVARRASHAGWLRTKTSGQRERQCAGASRL